MAPPPRVDAEALTRDQALAHASYVNLAAAGMLVVLVFLALAYAPVLPASTLTIWLASLGAPFGFRVLLVTRAAATSRESASTKSLSVRSRRSSTAAP